MYYKLFLTGKGGTTEIREIIKRYASNDIYWRGDHVLIETDINPDRWVARHTFYFSGFEQEEKL